MRWGLFFVAPLVACGSLVAVDDAGGADATVEACTSPSPFDCVDASFDVAPPPPPVVCPASPPTLGSSCTAPDYQDCEYGTQSYFCNQHFTCWFGQWQKNTSLSFLCGTDEACGTVVDGGACQSPGQACTSGDASVCVCSECGAGPPPPPGPDGASYVLRVWRCFAENAGCSPQRPSVGTTCDLPDGSACSYSHGGCCTGVFEKCVNGVWLGDPTEPCP